MPQLLTFQGFRKWTKSSLVATKNLDKNLQADKIATNVQEFPNKNRVINNPCKTRKVHNIQSKVNLKPMIL